VVDIVRAAGAIPIAAGSIIDRSGGEADVGLARAALATLHVPVVEPALCPLCLKGDPVTKPGSRPV
jgi:orotate phosphoribosyltransferase